MKRSFFLTILFLSFIFLQSNAQLSSKIEFVKNNGQWENFIHFKTQLKNANVYFLSDGVVFDFFDSEKIHEITHPHSPNLSQNTTIDFHAIKLQFLNTQKKCKIHGQARQTQYHNYFLGKDAEKWQSNVPIFSEILYENIYPNIDLKFYAKEGHLKYDFIVKQGGEIQDIQFQYLAADNIELSNGEIHVKTSLAEFYEETPIAFQENKKLNVDFQLKNGIASFSVPQNYDKTKTLIIDPSLIFSTFTGSVSDNFGYTATYAHDGSAYAGGIVFGNSFPSTLGAYQQTFAGGAASGSNGFGPIDMAICKFSQDGSSLIYATFLGGSGNEQPHSLIVDPDSNLLIFGRSSSANYPTSATAFDASLNGGLDIVVSKLNKDGSQLLASTYVGGSANDAANITANPSTLSSLKFNYADDARGDIQVDAFGNIYIATCTQSTNFPITAGAFQTTYGGGSQDACIFKLSPNMDVLVWSSFFGGSNQDAAYALTLNSSDEIYFTGGTNSANLPTTASALHPSPIGSIDGFVARVTNNGANLLNSTYIGTAFYDQSYLIQTDSDDEVYIVGQTSGNYPVSSGVYSNPSSGQFIHKLTKNLGSTVYSTVFGTGKGTPDISPTAFLVDTCEKIYVSGWGSFAGTFGNLSTTNLPTTADAFQTTTDGSDFYFIVFEKDLVDILYASFFGGNISAEHVDGGTSRFNKNGEIYQAVCAGCGGNSDFPTTPGVWSNTNNSSNCNLAVFKMEFAFPDLEAKIQAIGHNACFPDTVFFQNISDSNAIASWNFGDGTTSGLNNPSHVYNIPGTYIATLTVIDSNSCNIVDTAQLVVHVYEQTQAFAGAPPGIVCQGDSIQLNAGAIGGGDTHTFIWFPNYNISSTNTCCPKVAPDTTTTYGVIVLGANSCEPDTSYITIPVTPKPSVNIPVNTVSFCEGTGGTQLTANGSGGIGPLTYVWTPTSGLSFPNTATPIANPTNSGWYYVQVVDSMGCWSVMDSIFVQVNELPVVDAGGDKFKCANDTGSVLLQGQIINPNGVYSYQWYPSTNLGCDTCLQTYANPDSTTIYTLIATSVSTGCSSDSTTLDSLATITVFVLPRPTADAGENLNVCFGDSIQMNGTGFGTTGNYTYQWSPTSGLSDPNISTPKASPNFTTEYFLTVTDTNACTSLADSVTVFVHPIPLIDAGQNKQICEGNSIQLHTVFDTTLYPNYSVQWMPDSVIQNPNSLSPIVSPDTTTIFYLTVNNGTCSATDSVTIFVRPLPNVDAGDNQTICQGNSTILNANIDGVLPFTFYWQPSAGLNDSTLLQPIASPNQTTVYYLHAQGDSCLAYDSVLVTVSPQISVEIAGGKDTVWVCSGDSVQLTTVGGLDSLSTNFTWVPNENISDNKVRSPFVFPKFDTWYSLTASEGACSTSDSVFVKVIPTPKADFTISSDALCGTETVRFLNLSSDGKAYIWDFGDGSISNEFDPEHTYASSAWYSVSLTVINDSACQNNVVKDSLIFVGQELIADFYSEPSFPVKLYLPNTKVQFFNQSSGAITEYLWDFGDGNKSTEVNPRHEFLETGSFNVILYATDSLNCVQSVNHGTYEVLEPNIFLPNVFSPNGDGVNDWFKIMYEGSEKPSLIIFDRWGEKVFETNENPLIWDGKRTNGTKAKEGIYFYVLTIGDKKIQGNVSLVR